MKVKDPTPTPDVELKEGEQLTPDTLAELSNNKGDDEDE